MGLDTVEIVMRIEEEFSIELPDAELGAVITVGDLYEVVLSKLNTATNADCLSSKAVYRMRKSLVDVLGVPCRSIRPSTSLEPLLPAEFRRQQWAEIAAGIGLPFPKLKRTRSQESWLLKLALILPTVIVLASWGSLRPHLGLPTDSLLPLIPAFLAWILLVGFTNSLLKTITQAQVLEIPVRTAGELARMVLTMNFAEFAPSSDASQPLSRDAVWARIVRIFSDQMQMDEEEIVPDARIVQDLGIE